MNLSATGAPRKLATASTKRRQHYTKLENKNFSFKKGPSSPNGLGSVIGAQRNFSSTMQVQDTPSPSLK